ncbi:leucine--tRNA ligase [Candidatus Micrarchaeota archaeon]|nr:leucine--tRNA ligase [Candidatus Micrarchaeota archaeon]
MNFREIEAKWQGKWADAKLFEPDADGRKKFYLTAAFPYPNSPQHIGHARTYTTTDLYARFKRLQGYNVLFPMGFHVTGTPILAMATRLKEREEELLSLFEKVFGIPRDVSLKLTDPKELVSFFSREIEAGMKEMGFSIDWRRKFYTFDAVFNAFITWQFHKLKEKGFIKSGEHPVPWCAKCGNAVGAHDTKGDVDPELGEFVCVKFKFKDGFILTATFRPETLYGVTNVWFNPKVGYVKAKIDGEVYYISKEAARKFEFLNRKVEVLEECGAKVFEGGKCVNPINGEAVPLYPASFVDANNGSGVVMSVPAHAPYDFLALRDYAISKKIPVPKLVQVLKIDGYNSFPAQEISEKMGIRDQNDVKAEAATKEIYSKEAHTGVMVVGKYDGMKVIVAKDKIKEDLLTAGNAVLMPEIVNTPVFCRCGAQVLVRVVGNQWFIDYGNEEWKQLAHECLNGMSIVPSKALNEYNYTVDWLKQKACTRAHGLGTRFPFDDTQMIEALSDSTIYMVFYTIAHLNKKLGRPLSLEEFDFVLLGKGKGSKELEEMRESFLYWYPLDSRHSAGDLVHNHLTFFVFNHVGVFPRVHWPKQIVTNGFVLMEGGKMSKSLGNIMPLRKAIAKYGADVVRFSVVSGADLAADSDFNETLASGIVSRLNYFEGLLEGVDDSKLETENSKQPSSIDEWLLSRLHSRVANAERQFEELQLRALTQEFFYNLFNDLKWHEKRSGGSSRVLREVLEYWTLVVSPFMPHVAEEFWVKLGRKKHVGESKFASVACFPKACVEKINPRAELAEDIVVQTISDVQQIMKITKKERVGKISLYVAGEWKRRLYSIARDEKKFDSAMKRAMADEEIKKHVKSVAKMLQAFLKNLNSLSLLVLSEEEELKVLAEAREFLAREFGAVVSVARESEAVEAHAQKASASQPLKPSIYLE